VAARYLDLVELAVEAARTGDADTVERAVRAGVGVNSTSPRGDSLLMLSACHGHAAVVGVLLDLGADPHRRDGAGLRPVDRAREVGATDAVQVFERRGLA
jgi:ankyrin repeat protein